jgi:hypothetical protein
MNTKGSSVIVFVIAFVFILTGIFVAVLTVSGTFEKTGFAFLSVFNSYIFGLVLAFTLLIIGFLLLYFGMQGG